MPDETCAVFASLDGELDSTRVHRLVVGEDDEPRPLSPSEAKDELGDPFATLLLLEGTFPRTAIDCLTALDEATEANDPLRNQMSFVLGEGSQIPVAANTASLQRGMRFVVTRGATANGPPEGPDLLLSVFHPDSSDIELMAWDRRAGGFNYYRAVGAGPTWVFAGNARHALADRSQGKGPFESHKSGSLLMKELKLPWVNWDSPSARILATAFAEDDERRTHPWFTGKEPGGAYTLELAVARPAIARWAKVRFDSLIASAGTIERPGRIMAQILGTPTANLLSSDRESGPAAASNGPVELPPTFFVDADGLAQLGLQEPPEFAVAGNLYAASLAKFGVQLSDGQGFVQQGDTHFAFVIPERAFEDLATLQEAIRIGLVSRRLAAALLMTDFPNPVFSERRAALLSHVPASATVSNGQSTFSQEMADAILAAAAGLPADSPEAEFSLRWNVGEAFEEPFNQLLGDYYTAVGGRLNTQEGFDDYFRLAESRRQHARENPVFSEFALLFAETNIPPAKRAMKTDGTVV